LLAGLIQALAGDLQCLLGHDPERAMAHVAKARGVIDRVVDTEQQQAPDLRGFLLTSYPLCDKPLVCPRLAIL
jgi:hypothetical protein